MEKQMRAAEQLGHEERGRETKGTQEGERAAGDGEAERQQVGEREAGVNRGW